MLMCVGKYYIVNKDMDIILLVQEKCCIACLFDLFLFVNVVLCIFMSIVFVCAAVLRIYMLLIADYAENIHYLHHK